MPWRGTKQRLCYMRGWTMRGRVQPVVHCDVGRGPHSQLHEWPLTLG
jgi:hypothetical protein